MEYTLTVKSDNPKELASLLIAIDDFNRAVDRAGTAKAELAKATNSPKAAKEQPVKQQPAPAETAQEEQPAKIEADKPISNTVLREKFQVIKDKPGIREKVVALLGKFESKVLTDVPQDRRAEFIAELEKL